MKAYKHLVKFSLRQGMTISVWDGEEWAVSNERSYRSIVDAIESVEEAQLRIKNTDKKEMGWALVIPFGLEDDETVADNTMTEFMNSWDEAYNLTLA